MGCQRIHARRPRAYLNLCPRFLRLPPSVTRRVAAGAVTPSPPVPLPRSEEHTSELHHTVISYAVFCLKKKKKINEPQDSTRRCNRDVGSAALPSAAACGRRQVYSYALN